MPPIISQSNDPMNDGLLWPNLLCGHAPPSASIDSQDTLSFSVLSGVRSMNEVFPLEKAPEAYEQMMSGKARFRAVLTTGH